LNFLTNAPITARLHNNDGRIIARSALLVHAMRS